MTDLTTGRPSFGDQLRRRKPIAAPRGPHDGPELKRSFGTFQLMLFGVGATVGTGIFFVLQEAVPDAGPAVIVAFLVAGLAAGLSAICYAEVASAIPVSGSTYSYAYHSMGELVAMVVAACVLLEYGVSSAAVAVGWSGYFNELLQSLFGFHLPDALSYSPVPYEDNVTGLVNLPAVVLVILCMFLLLRGASESARVNTIMVLIKLGVLLLFVVIGLTAFESDHFAGFWDAGAAGISAAAGTIFFSFIGLDAVSTAGEEVRDPQRALPRAIMGALVVVVAIYVLVALAGVGAQPTEQFSDPEQQDAGLSVILSNITGSSVPGTVLAAGAVISIFSVTLVTLYGQTRILFAMGRDGMLPKKFASVNPVSLTPTFNTVVVSVVVALIAGFVPSDYLWDTVSIGTLIAFIVVATAVLVLRRTQPDLERPFRVPGYPVTPILTIAACVYILSGLAAITWVIFTVWLAVVLAFYLLWGRNNAALNRGVVADTTQPGAPGGGH
ncbi:amino acid permease [Nocardioides dongxiaopingii]|jgi:amino acid transporter|uniref:amino acid permease n=1 Tax=Nocardioides sp. S-1144 TaxID=2582905 RepID=UPI00116576DC|nr:amino acid permease [Nocardioides sp. S-1144]QDH11177.1 amino acid permease [Nocardioides sp. S-1144]